MSHFTRSFTTAAITATAAFSLTAQVTTSSLSGRITDAGNDVVIGATIQATHVPSGTYYGTVTNQDGRYFIHGMRPGGPYKIEISYIGNNTEVISDVQLNLGDTYPLNVKIREASALIHEVVIA